MSKFSEYLKLTPRIIGNLPQIIEGFINSKDENLSHEIQEEIIRRSEICAACPFNSENAKTSPEYVKAYGKAYTSERKDLHCSACACNLKAKIAAMSAECGLSYYNANHTKDEAIPLKWGIKVIKKK